MPNDNIAAILREVRAGQNQTQEMVRRVLAALDVEEKPRTKPRKRNPIAQELGDVLWVPVDEVFRVFAESPFAGMRPPGENFGVQAIKSLDSQYAALTPVQASKIIDETKVNDVVWQAERTDCDNISIYFAGVVSVKYGVNSVAIVDAIDEGHSYNAFLLRDEADNLSLRGFEPQTDQWRDDVMPQSGWIEFR